MKLAAVIWLAVLTSGCGATGIPAPTPAGMDEVVAALVVRGAAITEQVAGDAGCGDRTLFGNAVRLDVRMPGASNSAPVYLFRWRRQSDFDAASAAFAQCVVDFEQRTGAANVEQASGTLWRAYGASWPPELREAVDAALREAGGGNQ